MSYLPKNILKQNIDNVIKQNGAREITGPVLNDILIDIVDSDEFPESTVSVSAPDNEVGKDNDFWWRAGYGVYIKISGIYQLVFSVVSAPNKDFVALDNAFTYELIWDNDKVFKFGTHGNLQVWLDDGTGKFVLTSVQIYTDSVTAPTKYNFDFGGPATGFIVIS